MKDVLCRAFCEGLDVHDVPAGLAVRTTFKTTSGDKVGFYIRVDGGLYRIEDSGTVLPSLEAQGLDFRSGSRADALANLLDEYSVTLDMDDRQFAIDGIEEGDVPQAALRFVAFLLRVGDFALMT
jgi:hypothetical protein